jgi:hypothetical protein
MDFPWNKPSSVFGVPRVGARETHPLNPDEPPPDRRWLRWNPGFIHLVGLAPTIGPKGRQAM